MAGRTTSFTVLTLARNYADTENNVAISNPNLAVTGNLFAWDLRTSPCEDGFKHQISFQVRGINRSTGATEPWRAEGGSLSGFNNACDPGANFHMETLSNGYKDFEWRALETAGSYPNYTTTILAEAQTFDSSAPSGLSATDVEPTSVTIEWSDNSQNETGFEVRRSDDNFETSVQVDVVDPNSESLTDSTVLAANAYQYKVRALTPNGPTGWSEVLGINTLGLSLPLDTGFWDALGSGVCGTPATLSLAEDCIREQMHVYGVYYVETVACYEDSYGVGGCQRVVFAGPVNPPEVPDEDDPSIEPPANWVPPAKPGEAEWQWGGSGTGWPTDQGTWYRPCGPNLPNEILHWDGNHAPPKPPHWGYRDCDGTWWERAMDVVNYANSWREANTWF